MSATPPENPDYAGADGSPGYPGTWPASPGLPAAEVPQPRSIHNAVRLMWAGAALSVISPIVSLFNLDETKSQMLEQFDKTYPDMSQANLDLMFAMSIATGFITAMIGIGLWIWMAWKNGQGRGWARVVATVLGAFTVVSGPLSLAMMGMMGTQMPPTSVVFIAINLVLAIVILVLLWRKESSAFYAARSSPYAQFA